MMGQGCVWNVKRQQMEWAMPRYSQQTWLRRLGEDKEFGKHGMSGNGLGYGLKAGMYKGSVCLRIRDKSEGGV